MQLKGAGHTLDDIQHADIFHLQADALVLALLAAMTLSRETALFDTLKLSTSSGQIFHEETIRFFDRAPRSLRYGDLIAGTVAVSFGTQQRMASIQQAVSFLGFNSIKSLVLTSHVFSSLESSRVPGFSLERFQTYSLTVAALAKRFLAHSPFADEAFTAGLLHDLGRLVLVLRLPSRYAEVTRRVAEEGSTLSLIDDARPRDKKPPGQAQT